MPDRSIENHIEPVLSAYLEREQGQSGAHIRRPYTGAEKGKETMLAGNCKKKNDDYDDNDNADMMMSLMRYHICGRIMCDVSSVWIALFSVLCHDVKNISRSFQQTPFLAVLDNAFKSDQSLDWLPRCPLSSSKKSPLFAALI